MHFWRLPAPAGSFFLTLAALVGFTAQPAAASCPVILFDPATRGDVYVGLSDVGVLKSTDNGRTWNDAGLAWNPLSALVIDPQNSRTLYAGTWDGVKKSTNGGATWTPSGLADSNIDALAIDPRTPSVLFARASREPVKGWPGAVYKSIDGGAQWTLANDGLPEKGVRRILFSRQSSNVLYAATDSGVFKTADGGQRWSPSSAGIEGRTIVDVVLDVRDPETLYVAASRPSDSRVFKSTNGGRTWTDASTGLPGVALMELAADPSRPGVLYAGTSGRGLYRTTDAGAGWASTGLRNAYPCGVAVSPHDPQLILAATTGDVQQGYFTLLRKSVDGGTRWEVLEEGLPSISSIAGQLGEDHEGKKLAENRPCDCSRP